MPHRIAIASCSHPSLPQPLWPILHSRNPAAFVWAGDAIYADVFRGLDWKAVGLHRVPADAGGENGADGSKDGKGKRKWQFTFPPPSIHQDATPEIIRGWYERQWGVDSYRQFVLNVTNATSANRRRPMVFGTIDDHDYGANNGDATYRYRRESNLEFMHFLYKGDEEDDAANGIHSYDAKSCLVNPEEKDDANVCSSGRGKGGGALHSYNTKSKQRSKANDPMYQRALQGEGVYGVQLFDFSRDPDTVSKELDDNEILWGGGYWVPEREARIDPDLMDDLDNSDSEPNYSTTQSVAVFVLDVRSNKTPWPNKNNHTPSFDTSTTQREQVQHHNETDTLSLDFLGSHQWKWLRSALANSHATINIFVSGLQIHPNRFPNDGNILEEWSKFPQAQQLLYETILNSGVSAPLFVSGDVHMSQILSKDCVPLEEVLENDSMGNKESTESPMHPPNVH